MRVFSHQVPRRSVVAHVDDPLRVALPAGGGAAQAVALRMCHRGEVRDLAKAAYGILKKALVYILFLVCWKGNGASIVFFYCFCRSLSFSALEQKKIQLLQLQNMSNSLT